MTTSSSQETRTHRLVKWAADLKYNDIPDDVVQRTKDFFLDTLGCAIAGRSHPAVSAMVRFAAQMGPPSGKSELIDGSQTLTTSPAFASLINAAASHVVEQDDLHNRSIMHPVSLASVLIVLVAPQGPLSTHAAYDDRHNAYLTIGNCDFPSCACSIPRYWGKWRRFHHCLRGWLRGRLSRWRVSGEEPLRGKLH